MRYVKDENDRSTMVGVLKINLFLLLLGLYQVYVCRWDCQVLLLPDHLSPWLVFFYDGLFVIILCA